MYLSKNAKKNIAYLYFNETMDKDFHDGLDLTIKGDACLPC